MRGMVRMKIMATSAQLPGLDERPITEEDVRPIRSVLEHIKDDGPIALMAKNIVWWLAAFDMFKKLECKLGLPVSSESKVYYGALVAHLKSAGKMSLLIADKNPQILQFLEIKKTDIEARVKELSWDDHWVENPITPEDEKKLQAAFG